MLQDARAKLRSAVDHSLELVEKAIAAALRFTREPVQRVDEAAAEPLTGAERLLRGAVRAAREPPYAAAPLATTAVTRLTAWREAPRTPDEIRLI